MTPLIILPPAATMGPPGATRREVDALLSVQRFFAEVLVEPWDVRTNLEAGVPPVRPFALIELAGPGLTTGGPAVQDRSLPIIASLYLPEAATRDAALNTALLLREDVWQAVRWGHDPGRPTTDRIPLYSYMPRVERHRFKVTGATAGSFTVTVNGQTTIALSVATADAEQLAAMIGVAIGADPGDVVGTDRGRGLWDIEYAGALAGEILGAPAIDGALLAGPRPVALARVMLQGAAAPWRAPCDYMRVDSFQQNTIRDPVDPQLVMVAVDLRLTFGRGLPLPSGQRILQRISATVGSG